MTLPVTAEPLPSSYTFGKVVGRVIHLIADTAADTDDKPEARAASGKVRFYPEDVLAKTVEADYPAIVLRSTEVALLSSSGYVTDAEGNPGIWLAVGVYRVSFEITGASRAIPDFTISVTSDYTDAAPLDLATVVPYVVPSGVTVETAVIPVGGSVGQVLVRGANNTLTWQTDGVTQADLDALGTSSADPNTLVRRNSDGAVALGALYLSATDLGNPASATRKDYVDALGSTDAATPGVVRRGVDGAIGATNLYLATATPPSAQHATPKAYVDGVGTDAANADTIARRNAGGGSGFGYAWSNTAPTAADHLTRKDYVDAVGTNAATPSTIMRRDAAGRAKVADGSAATDIATKGQMDTADALKVAKSGDAMTGTLNFPNYDQVYVPEANLVNKALTGGVLANSIASGPFADMWHDTLAFSKHLGVPTFERTADGATWTSQTLDAALFAQKQSQNLLVLDTSTHRGVRWTWNSGNLQYGNNRWFVLGVAYNAVQPTVTVTVESSADGITWTQRHTSSYVTPGQPIWFKVADISGDSRLRLTLTAPASTGNVRLSSIRLMSFRWGDQGGGSETSYPYTWDEAQGVTFVRAFSSNAAAGATELVRKQEMDAAIAGVTSGGAVDASPTVKGIVQLTNHLGGTATSPTVRSGSETQTGILELATAAETTTGTSTALAVHPAGLKVELDKKAPLSHTHTASQISDSTTVGRSVVTAVDAAAARTATGAAASALTKNTVSASYTLVAADAVDKVLHTTSATALTITLPSDANAVIGQEIAIPWRQFGAGQITFAAGAGATLISRGSVFKSAGQNAEGLITKVAANTWLLSGDITA